MEKHLSLVKFIQSFKQISFKYWWELFDDEDNLQYF